MFSLFINSQGKYVNGLREGKGEFWWGDGRSYKGSWKAGLMHGDGVETDAAGKK